MQGRIDEVEELLKEVWASVPECVYRVNSKVGSPKWFGVLNTFDKFIPLWARRVTVVMFMGPGTGVFKCKRSPALAKLIIARAQEGDVMPKASAKSETVDIATIRKSCANTPTSTAW